MKLSRDPKQLARVSGMLPDGMTIEQATTGFRNQGQFVAALNASRNQGVAFADLQQAMTVDGLSLGQAVKQLRNAPPAPEAPAAGAGHRANDRRHDDRWHDDRRHDDRRHDDRRHDDRWHDDRRHDDRRHDHRRHDDRRHDDRRHDDRRHDHHVHRVGESRAQGVVTETRT